MGGGGREGGEGGREGREGTGIMVLKTRAFYTGPCHMTKLIYIGGGESRFNVS